MYIKSTSYLFIIINKIKIKKKYINFYTSNYFYEIKEGVGD